jgi:hypothetical protein
MCHHLGIDANDRTVITFASRHLSNGVVIDVLANADIINANGDNTDAAIEEFVSTYIHDQF